MCSQTHVLRFDADDSVSAQLGRFDSSETYVEDLDDAPRARHDTWIEPTTPPLSQGRNGLVRRQTSELMCAGDEFGDNGAFKLTTGELINGELKAPPPAARPLWTPPQRRKHKGSPGGATPPGTPPARRLWTPPSQRLPAADSPDRDVWTPEAKRPPPNNPARAGVVARWKAARWRAARR
jgi:hypothetical protein